MERVYRNGDEDMIINIANHEGMIIWDGVYYFALSGYPHITPWELKKLLVFMDYEKQHGRQTEIMCENNEILSAVKNAVANPETVENAVLPSKITECTACKQHGCLTRFVCHTAEIENAKKILSSGKLLSALKASGRTVDELIFDKRNAAGDPADYFDYIMFAWGNCIAGDSLVIERGFVKNHDRLPNQAELNDANKKNLITGIRFYFQYEDIIKHPGYVFDGYHPAKVKDELVLTDYLYACIVPEQYKNELTDLVTPELSNRIHYLAQNGLGIMDWSERVYNFVEGLEIR